MRMIDKIIMGLECSYGNEILCKDCGYSKDGLGDAPRCQRNAINDALEYLKKEASRKITCETCKKKRGQWNFGTVVCDIDGEWHDPNYTCDEAE